MRLPDFLIIGAMKAGTTSLFRWLGTHSSVSLPAVKEPGYFCDDSWRNKLHLYSELYAGVSNELITGEATTSYTAPQFSARAASRISETLPNVRLIFLARDPVARLRSHYRHEVQRGREKERFAAAVALSDHYIGTSQYFQCLKPYLDRFDRKQICLVSSDKLLVPPHDGWRQVLTFLQIPYEQPSGTAFNVSAEKARFSPLMLWLWERGLVPKGDYFPDWLRTIGGKILLRRGLKYESLIRSSKEPLPAHLNELLTMDTVQLEHWLGRELWEHTAV